MVARNSREEIRETAESLALKQREISVSEFFLKNRHLLGFDNPRKALLTAVKEAVDNALDACDEAGILPEISVDVQQVGQNRFRLNVTDNGPGIVRAQIPKIFAKLLYGSKFHRLRMSRGQQGIGISAAGMYAQLTTGCSTRILSKIKSGKKAHMIEVQIDTTTNKPVILKDVEVEWIPQFPKFTADGKQTEKPVSYSHGTSVSFEMEATYVRGRLSMEEYLRQCAIVNPHMQMYCHIALAPKEAPEKEGGNTEPQEQRLVFHRASKTVPKQPREIKPHPHGVELGMLMQILKSSSARTVRAALTQDFSRMSLRTAIEVCQRAGLDPKASPSRIAHRESEALFKAINETKLMRPPTDCLSPIGEHDLIEGLKKEVNADFCTAVTRSPAVYRGNPFQIEVALAWATPAKNDEVGSEDPVRVMRFANRVPMLYMAGACAITKAITGVNWKAYGLSQPQGSLPLGPAVILIHMAGVWVPFTSESKEAIAHYPEIIRETTFALQECGRRLSVHLSRRRRQVEIERKRSYMSLYIPHVALGLKQILELTDREESRVVSVLNKLLERTHLQA